MCSLFYVIGLILFARCKQLPKTHSEEFNGGQDSSFTVRFGLKLLLKCHVTKALKCKARVCMCPSPYSHDVIFVFITLAMDLQ